VLGDWSYDAYVQAGSHDSTESQSGNTLRSRIHELTYAADGGLAACGGLRLFGADSVSQECADYIAAGGTNRAGFDQTIAEVSFSGPAASLPAGDLKLALGLMYKRDEYYYRADPIGSVLLDDGFSDIQGFNASDDIEGSDHNTDLYVEAAVPVLRDLTGVERLEVLLGYRHSEYDSAGGVDAYKAELLPARPAATSATAPTPRRSRPSASHRACPQRCSRITRIPLASSRASMAAIRISIPRPQIR